MDAKVDCAAPMRGAETFSENYAIAGGRIRAAAKALGAQVERYSIAEKGPAGEELSLDAVRVGSASARRLVVVSSGVHGVEGFFGSAVQLALLRSVLPRSVGTQDPAVLILHAVNPYGFAWIRRVNESNVDLNRNFPTARQTYAGCPEAYRSVDDLINPTTPPRRDFFYPRVADKVLRQGFASLKQAVVGGQYERPQGLFYGGDGPSAIVDILDRALPDLLGEAEQVLHLDLHTGLGRWGKFKLLLGTEEAASDSQCWRRFKGAFPAETIEVLERDGAACQVEGSFGEWCRERFADRDYDTVAAEFGTYSPLKVLAALREENRAHHWGDAGAATTRRAKGMLVEAFAPRSEQWRDQVVEEGIRIVGRAMQAMRNSMPRRRIKPSADIARARPVARPAACLHSA
jgi:predicted deacylase